MPKPLKHRLFRPPIARGKVLRVGLYARVSTHDQKTLPLQLSAMRDYAKKRNWAVAIEVQGMGSGATTRPQRQSARRDAGRVCGVRRDRVKAGIDQARKDGKPHGRPMTAGKLVTEMKQDQRGHLNRMLRLALPS